MDKLPPFLISTCVLTELFQSLTRVLGELLNYSQEKKNIGGISLQLLTPVTVFTLEEKDIHDAVYEPETSRI